jgi:hypothetical protein
MYLYFIVMCNIDSELIYCDNSPGIGMLFATIAVFLAGSLEYFSKQSWQQG